MKFNFTEKVPFWGSLFLLGIIYSILIYLKAKNTLLGDEGGYLTIASDLAKGQLNVVHWWGPGYPLILTLFVKYNLPLIWAKLLNAAFLIGTIVYIRSTLLLYINEKFSNRIALIMGIYLPFLLYAHMIFSENLAIFLTSAALYHYLALYEKGKIKIIHFTLCSILLCWLALTKVIYGYVILVSIIVACVVKLFFINRLKIGKTISILSLSLLLCVPYLWHNYSLTGKIFYWATSGGMSLYWMSTPYAGETGTWFGRYEFEEKKVCVDKNHYDFYNSLVDLSSVERDDEYKRAAIKNIRMEPMKFLFNIGCNILRMFFNFPQDYNKETWKTSWVVIPNMFLLTLFFFSIYPAWKARHLIPPQIVSILIFATITFMGELLLSAYNRMFTVIVPIIVVWTAYIWIRLVQIKINSI